MRINDSGICCNLWFIRTSNYQDSDKVLMKKQFQIVVAIVSTITVHPLYAEGAITEIGSAAVCQAGVEGVKRGCMAVKDPRLVAACIGAITATCTIATSKAAQQMAKVPKKVGEKIGSMAYRALNPETPAPPAEGSGSLSDSTPHTMQLYQLRPPSYQSILPNYVGRRFTFRDAMGQFTPENYPGGWPTWTTEGVSGGYPSLQ